VSDYFFAVSQVCVSRTSQLRKIALSATKLIAKFLLNFKKEERKKENREGGVG